jgi:hypothetical protein
MGKTLRDLLNDYQFQDEKLNPRNVKEDMLSSRQVGREITIPGLSVGGVKLPYDRQYSLLTQNITEIYGADAPRILLRGTVDLNKATKKIVNRAARIAGGLFGNNNAVGSFVRNSITGLVSVKQPSDTISGNSTENGLYSDILNARVDNSKNPITGLLTQFKTPSQFKAAVGDISNGKVKIGGAVVDELTNLSFKGLGWAAAKIGLGKQDAGKTKSLSQTLKDSTNSNSTGRTKFPSFFAEIKANFSKSKIIPTGIITGQDQFAKLGNFPNMYDDSPVKTGLTLDGVARNVRTSTGLADNYNDYLTKNPIEDFRKFGIFSPYGNGDTIDAQSGDRLKTQGDLGFNTNNETFGPRSQTFSAGLGINEGYSLKDTILTNQRNQLEDFLIVNDGNEGMYKIPNIIKDGRPTRFFSSKVVDASGNNIDVSFFGGYKNRREADRAGDHRLKSEFALNSNSSSFSDIGNDLIKIRFGYGTNEKNKRYTHLLSNITGFTDTPTVSWGEAKPVGSPHKFYFYESFEREVSFKTQIYATSQENLSAVWVKANAIMDLTKGNSRGVAGIAGKICSLRIGDMFDSNYGFITSCTLTVPDISPWEIKEGSQLPFVCEMDISYKVIQVGKGFYGPNGLIDYDAQNPAYQFNDFPSKVQLPPPNNFNSLPRPQIGTVDLVKLPNPTLNKLSLNRFDEQIQRENALNPPPTEQDDILAQNSTRSQRLQEIENIRTNNLGNGGFGEFSEVGTNSDTNRIKIESKPKSSTTALGGAGQ